MGNHITAITEYLWRQSWQLALLIVAVAVVCRIVRNRSAHVRYLLWLIVLAKCLVPPVLTIPLAILPAQQIAEPRARLPVAPPLVIPEVPRQAGDRSMVIPPVSAERDMSEARTSSFTMPSGRQTLGAVWIIGVAVFGCVSIAKVIQSNLRLRRQRRPLPDDLQASVGEVFCGFGMESHPKVWLLNGVGQPFVWGLLRGDIYLPADYLRIDNAAHRRNILGHEVCHILRLDAAVNSLQVLAQAVFWFHPLVWWANQKIRIEREKCCDEMAVAYLRTRAKEYSAAIIKALISEHETARPVPSLAVAGPAKDIEERIRTMLKPGKKFYRRPTSVALTVALLFAVCAVPTTLVLTARAGTQADVKSLPQAAAAGDVEQVKLLISKGADIDAKDEDGWTSLHSAAYYGLGDVAKVLLAEGANVNATDRSGGTPLHLGVEFGAKYVPELLIAKGANINARDNAGNTPLHHAAGRLEIQQDLLELLIVKTNDVNVRNNRGQTPLHCLPRTTKQSSNLELTINALIAHGADVNARDNSGCTPLHYAGQRIVAERLLARGADVNTKASDGTTALHRAVMGGRYDVVEFLLDKGAGINVVQSDGRTALLFAIGGRSDSIAELLIARGADVNAEGNDGWSPLDLAGLGGEVKLCALLTAKGAKIKSLCSAAAAGDLAKVERFIKESTTANEKDVALCAAAACGQQDVVEWLISKGVSASARDKREQTALHLAARGGYSDVVKQLLANGAVVNAKDVYGGTPLHWATRNGHKEVIAILIDKGADINAKNNSQTTPFQCAARNGHREVAELLIDKGADFKPGLRGLLDNVCWTGHRDVAELLLQKGAPTNRPEPYYWVATHSAVFNGHADIVELLLAHGADPDAKDRWGWSNLHYAGSAEITKLLLDKGANPNAVERERGRTPLIGVAGGRREGRDYKTMAELLISHGADVNAKDWEGDTPLSRAQEAGNTDIVELLKKHGAKE